MRTWWEEAWLIYSLVAFHCKLLEKMLNRITLKTICLNIGHIPDCHLHVLTPWLPRASELRINLDKGISMMAFLEQRCSKHMANLLHICSGERSYRFQISYSRQTPKPSWFVTMKISKFISHKMHVNILDVHVKVNAWRSQWQNSFEKIPLLT